MIAADDADARHPPSGLDERFSRLRDVPGRDADEGATRTWHFLDTGPALDELGVRPAGTILAVHGNPTWSYLWRAIVARTVEEARQGGPAWRVVAVDQLEMGFSERTGIRRTLPQRVSDLGAFTDAIGLEDPVITLGHDWGGVISLGWAIDHPALLRGVALLNTAIHHPAGVPLPAPLRLARARGILEATSVARPAFLDTTLALAHPPLDPAVRASYRAPYATASRREGIGAFVADIPVGDGTATDRELDRIARGVGALRVPALLLWGPRDPIFGDRYLDDLVDRLPHAHVHRYEGAGHLLAEDRPYADAVLTWLGDRVDPTVEASVAEQVSDAAFVPLWQALEDRSADGAVAVIDMSVAEPLEVSWRMLHDRVVRIAAGLVRGGLRPGDRVSLLVPPGPTLTAVVYACLRIGAVVVVADAGLGVKGLSRAIRGAQPDVIIAGTRGLLAARALRWPGRRISVPRLPASAARALRVTECLDDVAAAGSSNPAPPPPAPGPDDEAAILFTSGSTGPAKGVVYTHGQLAALRDVLGAHFDVGADTGLVTGFAPFALLGPALGTRSVTPAMDVSSPRTLTAVAVAAAVRASGARIVFLSPAAILNVVATADALSETDRAALAQVSTFLSTGAPVGAELLEAATRLMPNASAHTPYGMTECLLVTDITLDGIRSTSAAPDRGVCVGMPIGANRVLISALDADGRAVGEPSVAPHVLGEVVISAAHLKAHYDRLWLTDREAVRDTADLPSDGGARWHRTGDVGHLDAQGRLWIEGRLPHVLVTESGPVAPVGPEQQVERVRGVRRAAVVGIGPRGLQQAVAVVETEAPVRRPGLADPALTAAVRAASDREIAAVLVTPLLPTDIRHNSKIDRTALATWADGVLSGTAAAS